MKALLTTCGLVAATAALILVGTQDEAEALPGTPFTGTYSVTLTNLTRAQIFSPALVATHRGAASMFHAGTAAGPELQALAEDGDNSLLMTSLAGDANVLDIAPGMGMIHPGMSETIMINADTDNPLISIASMLVSTNDTFLGLDAAVLPLRNSEFLLHAYDAGTEYNSEDCAFIPGPPCGNGGVHDPTPAEGFIYISNGLHGIAGALGVPEETYDWTGPVARVEIRRVQ
jgi:hypothetical protein